MWESHTADDERVNGGGRSDSIILIGVPSCGYILILSGSASCMLKRKFKSEDGNVLMQTYSDNISILAASPDGLVPKCHHTSASVRQNRLTADTVCTICGRSSEVDK